MNMEVLGTKLLLVMVPLMILLPIISSPTFIVDEDSEDDDW